MDPLYHFLLRLAGTHFSIIPRATKQTQHRHNVVNVNTTTCRTNRYNVCQRVLNESVRRVLNESVRHVLNESVRRVLNESVQRVLIKSEGRTDYKTVKNTENHW